MGIENLLQAVKGKIETKDISTFKGWKVAVDVSGWLHKGLYGAAEDLVDSNFVDSQLYVDYVLNRVAILQGMGIEPVLVFDGRRNCLKDSTNSKRQDIRNAYINKGKTILKTMKSMSDMEARKKLRKEAIANFQKGMAVTPEMESNTIGALRRMGVQVVVAPYEADSQLAYLCKTGVCQAVMTEDSDVIVYSMVCEKPFTILFKFDRKSNTVDSLDCATLFDTKEKSRESEEKERKICPPDESGFGGGGKERKGKRGKGEERQPKVKAFLQSLRLHFHGRQGIRMFAQMCILAGCDYAESLQGVGLMTAMQAVIKFRDCPDVRDTESGLALQGCDARFHAIASFFRAQNRAVDHSYLTLVRRAEALFFYHPVYDTTMKEIVHFTEPRFAPTLPANQSSPAMEVRPSDTARGNSASKARRGRLRSNSVDSIESFESESQRWDGGAGVAECGGAVSSAYGEQPEIDYVALAALGGAGDLMRAAKTSKGSPFTGTDDAQLVHKLCLGLLGCQDYREIAVKYPWDNPSFRFPRYQGWGGGYWGTRYSLMRLLTPEIDITTRSSGQKNRWNSHGAQAAKKGQQTWALGTAGPATAPKQILTAFARTAPSSTAAPPSSSHAYSSITSSSHASVVSTSTRRAASAQGALPSKGVPARQGGVVRGSIGFFGEKEKECLPSEDFKTTYTLTLPLPAPKSVHASQEVLAPAPPPASTGVSQTRAHLGSPPHVQDPVQGLSLVKRQPLRDRTNESPEAQEVVNLVDSPRRSASKVANPKAWLPLKVGSGGKKRNSSVHQGAHGIKSVKTSKSGKGKVVKMMSISAFFSQKK
jgi:5'-3' exonuclease